MAEHRVALLIFSSSCAEASDQFAEESETLTCLRRHGFRVSAERYTSADAMRRIIQRFATGAPINGTALVYFCTAVANGRSFEGKSTPLLYPDADAENAIPLTEVLDRLHLHSATRQNIVLVNPVNRKTETLEPIRQLFNEQISSGTWIGVLNSRASDDKNERATILKSFESIPGGQIEARLKSLCVWSDSTCSQPILATQPTSTVSTPDLFPGHAKPGDEWVANDGSIYCYCPSDRKSKGFWIGKYEVTQGKWPIPNRVRGVGTRRNLPTIYQQQKDITLQLQQHTKAEQAAGRLRAGWEYRLPTGEEWSWAASAGTNNEHDLSDQQLAIHANFADKTLFDQQRDEYLYAHTELSDGFAEAASVGNLKPNAWGLHDVLGNVWELTASGELRGGSWVSLPDYCRVFIRKPPLQQPVDYAGLRIMIANSQQ